MIEEPPRLKINSARRRPSAAQIAAFQGVPTGFVVDAMFGAGALDAAISPIGFGRDITCVAAGPALTADNRPSDIMGTLAALNFLQEGDVLVSAFGGHQGCAAAGDRLAGMLKNNGVSGFVTDGPARDYEGIVAVGLPIWCTGLTPATPHMSGPGTVGLPIQIGGQEVETGDMIVADQDGVTVVPFERLDEVIESLQRITELEAELDAKVAAGLKVPDWVDEILESDRTVRRD